MDSESKYIGEILARRKEFIQLVCVAAILALGINLLAGSIIANKWLPKEAQTYLALALILGALVWVSVLSFRRKAFVKEFEACFLLDSENNIVAIHDYEFSSDLARTLNAVLRENSAFDSLWKLSPLSHKKKKESATDSETTKTQKEQPSSDRKPAYLAITKLTVPDERGEPKSATLLREAIEYIILDELSLHLSAYFNEYSDEDKYIKEYQRRDIPSLLLENRVLELLTTPFEERAAFVSMFKDDKSKPKGEIRTIYAEDGTVFDRFDLVLPAETIITRPKPGTICIENKRFLLTMTCSYQGFSGNIPLDFVALYLQKDPDKIDVRQVTIGLEYKVKAFSLLRRSGWEYYHWVDSFSDTLEQKFSVDSFFRKIQWDSLSVLFQVLHNRDLARSKVKLSKGDPENQDSANGA
jgi:hypothetical protein